MEQDKTQPALWTYRFVNVCVANFLMACSFNLLMPSIPLYITEQLGVPQTQTGIVLASYGLAILIFRPFSGFMVDVYPRKTMLLVSFVAYVAIFAGYFFVATVAMFVAVRFFHGIAWGASSVSSSTLAIDVTPSERRAEGIGYYGTFMNVAMAVGPFIAIHIYQTSGFHVLLRYAVGMGLLGIVAVALIRAPRRPKVVRNKVSLDRFFLLPSWPIFLNQLLPCFGWGTIGPFVAQYGKQIQVPNAGIFFLFWAGGIILSRVFSGRLVDRGRAHQVNVVAMAVVAAAFYCFASYHNIYAFCGAGLFIGVGFGMMLPALQTLYINMAEHRQRGTANSTYLVSFDLGLALGMLVGGYVSGTWSFEALFLLAAVLCAVSIAVYWTVSRPLFEKKRLR